MSQQPSVGRVVHYVSYGTPGGEFPSVCRAAIITEVGAWAVVEVSDVRGHEGDRKTRTVTQEWDRESCALVVQNPTGLFFNTCAHDEAKNVGTWHWPERV